MKNLLSLVSLFSLFVFSQQTPVFRAGVDYVLADVVVTDGRDQPVRGLTRDDFEVVMRDRRLPVVDFKEISIPPGDRQIVTCCRRTSSALARPSAIFCAC